MKTIADHVRQELIRLVPASTVEDVACFVFFDNHPRDIKLADITVCTKNGVLREYLHRNILSTITLDAASTPEEIIILRNSESDLFYIVCTNDELFIVSSKETLQVHSKITNVEKFSVDDTGCNGQAYLKVTRKDDAVPIIFDENFKRGEILFSEPPSSHTLPPVTELKTKYIEAQYINKVYEKSIEEYVRLRHASTLMAYQNIHPHQSKLIFNSSSNIFGSLKLKAQKPWVKVCNRKIIIALKVWNEYKESVDKVEILLNSAKSSLTYTTKLFKQTEKHPHWIEKHTQKLSPNCEYTAVAVVNLDELKMTVSSRIVVNGVISYRLSEKTYLMPFEDIVISTMETLGDEFDALSSKHDSNTMIAILSSTEKTDLRIRHITTLDETIIDLLIRHLKMERISTNALVYNKSPYHALNGIFLHFVDGTDQLDNVTVYSRLCKAKTNPYEFITNSPSYILLLTEHLSSSDMENEAIMSWSLQPDAWVTQTLIINKPRHYGNKTKSQVLALIHSITDAVPSKIIITTQNYAIIAKTPELSKFTEPIPKIREKNYSVYAKSLLSRTGKIIGYLDGCMVKMSESKDPDIQKRVGSHIDLYACGKSSYEEFRERMLEESRNGATSWGEEIGPEFKMIID